LSYRYCVLELFALLQALWRLNAVF
jgi:hypothetical protein